MIPRNEEAFKRVCEKYPESNPPKWGIDKFLEFVNTSIKENALSSGGHWFLMDYCREIDGNPDYCRFLGCTHEKEITIGEAK